MTKVCVEGELGERLEKWRTALTGLEMVSGA